MLLVEGERLLVPSSSIQSLFLRPAEIWLMTTEPTAPRVGLELDEGGVFGRHLAQLAAPAAVANA